MCNYEHDPLSLLELDKNVEKCIDSHFFLIACTDDFYGPGCVQTCGECLDNDLCDKINGECPNGCQPGFQGQTCKEGKKSIIMIQFFSKMDSFHLSNISINKSFL